MFSECRAGAVAGEPDPNALDHWVLRTNVYLNAIVYGDGKFVGVGTGGIFNSPDGRQWRQVEDGSSAFDVIYAADRFVAVGYLSRDVLISTNGVHWTGMNAVHAFLGVTYGDGKFVAVGEGGPVSVSEDGGLSWTNVIHPTNATLYSAAYGIGQFVAVGVGGRTLRSTNGYDWVGGNIGTNAPFYDVLYAEGLFVAVSFAGVIYASEDGVAWTQQASFPNPLFHVVHHNGVFVSAGEDTVVSSLDGRNWTTRVAPTIARNQSIIMAAAGANTFLISALGNSSSQSALWQSSPLTYVEPQVQLPTHVAVPVGSTLRLNGVALGTLPVSYQWEKDGTIMEGATSAGLTISNVNGSHAGHYRVRVSNVVSTVLSDAGEIKVGLGPSFVSPVPHVSAVVGGTAVLTTSSAGTPPLTFIWRRPNLFMTSAVQVLNVSNSFLRLSPVQASDGGIYGVTVTNLFGTNVSGGGAGRLTVEADNDGDGLGDVWESLYRLNTNDMVDANLDSDGDLHSSLEEFIAGTDPTNAASVLRISEIATSANNGAHLKFTAMSNVTYSIETKADASAGTWTRLRDVMAARTNRTVSVLDSGAPGSRIYRLVTPAQP